MNTRDEGAYFAARLAQAPPLRYGPFRPFRLVVELGSPVCITSPGIALDGLVAHLLLLDGLGEDFFVTPKKRDLTEAWPRNRRFLPLKRTGDVYHASWSQFDPPAALKVTTIYKRFETSGTERLRQQRIRRGQGYFRDYMLREPYVPARRVIFYGCGDPDLIGRLVEDYIIGIGNDSRIGFGAVRSWSIEEVAEDWSLVAEGIAMRPIPVEMCSWWEDQAYLAYKAPYWSPKNVTLCVPPGVRCRLKEGLP